MNYAACIEALDWMPGCSWPLWLQLVAALVAYALIVAVMRKVAS